MVTNRTLSCDIAVIGGGLGGVAVALAACDAGASVVLTEATDWLGGQATSQGVSALDEHRYIEAFGATRRYAAFREAIRDHYRRRYGIAAMPDGSPLNPGDAWVSALCFEPQVGVSVIEAMLAPHVAAGRLTILRNYAPISAIVPGDAITSVTVTGADGDVTIAARFFLDATDLGDLLPLTGAPWVTGAEARSDTGEADAPEEARPGEVQGFTFCFAVEYRPGEDHTIPKPEGYERLRDSQPFTLTLTAADGAPRPFRVFETGPTGLPPFWTYRRLLSGRLLDPLGTLRDVAMINWNANDYHHADLIGATPEERTRILDEARRLSLSFLYWLQTEVPRDDGSGYGYPGLRLLPNVMGTKDGLSKAPYIRESRRIQALRRVTANDILAAGRTTARAAHFSYRLHPVEWNIGEAAGALAAFCLTRGISPREVWEGGMLRTFQRHLLEQGIPLAWALNCGWRCRSVREDRRHRRRPPPSRCDRSSPLPERHTAPLRAAPVRMRRSEARSPPDHTGSTARHRCSPAESQVVQEAVCRSAACWRRRECLPVAGNRSVETKPDRRHQDDRRRGAGSSC
jgi:hypothetical protein